MQEYERTYTIPVRAQTYIIRVQLRESANIENRLNYLIRRIHKALTERRYHNMPLLVPVKYS